MYKDEIGRINTYINTLGREAARQKALSTARIYRSAVLHKGHFANTRAYKRRFIMSYLHFKSFYFTGVI